MMISKRFILALAVAFMLTAPLAACNTMEGIGHDAQAFGEAISGAAQKTKGY